MREIKQIGALAQLRPGTCTHPTIATVNNAVTTENDSAITSSAARDGEGKNWRRKIIGQKASRRRRDGERRNDVPNRDDQHDHNQVSKDDAGEVKPELEKRAGCDREDRGAHKELHSWICKSRNLDALHRRPSRTDQQLGPAASLSEEISIPKRGPSVAGRGRGKQCREHPELGKACHQRAACR